MCYDKCMDKHTKGYCRVCKLDNAVFTHYIHKNGENLYNKCDSCRRDYYAKFKNPDPKFIRPKKSKPDKCRICGKTGDIFSSRLNGSGARYYNLDCNTCRGRAQSTYMKRLRVSDPNKYYEKARHTKLQRSFGISLLEYRDMFAKQGERCAICGTKEGKNSMPLDHDHKTNKNRTILCHWCNKGLGQFFDDADKLRKAADYLDSWAG